MIYFSLAFKNLGRFFGKFFVIHIIFILSILSYVLIGNSINNATSLFNNNLTNNPELKNIDFRSDLGDKTIPNTTIEEVKKVKNVVDVFPFVVVDLYKPLSTTESANNSDENYDFRENMLSLTLKAIPEKYMKSIWNVSSDLKDNEVILYKKDFIKLHSRLGTNIGDTVYFLHNEKFLTDGVLSGEAVTRGLKIVGVWDGIDYKSESSFGVTSFEFAQKLYAASNAIDQNKLENLEYKNYSLQLKDLENASQVSDDLRKLNIITSYQIALSSDIVEVAKSINNVKSMVSIILFVLVSIIMYFMYRNFLFERRKDFGILYSIGYNSSDIFKFMTLELIYFCILTVLDSIFLLNIVIYTGNTFFTDILSDYNFGKLGFSENDLLISIILIVSTLLITNIVSIYLIIKNNVIDLLKN